MSCIEQWTERFKALGLSPLPAHLVLIVEAMCAGTSADGIGEFLIRTYSWPKRLLELSRVHTITDEEFKNLHGLYLAEGESDNFERAVGALSNKGAVGSNVGKLPPNVPVAMSNFNDKLRELRERRAANFDEIVKDEQQGRGNGAPSISSLELEGLKEHFVTGAISDKDLRQKLALSADSQPKP
jgi:hypothetical protein